MYRARTVLNSERYQHINAKHTKSLRFKVSSHCRSDQHYHPYISRLSPTKRRKHDFFSTSSRLQTLEHPDIYASFTRPQLNQLDLCSIATRSSPDQIGLRSDITRVEVGMIGNRSDKYRVKKFNPTTLDRYTNASRSLLKLFLAYEQKSDRKPTYVDLPDQSRLLIPTEQYPIA